MLSTGLPNHRLGIGRSPLSIGRSGKPKFRNRVCKVSSYYRALCAPIIDKPLEHSICLRVKVHCCHPQMKAISTSALGPGQTSRAVGTNIQGLSGLRYHLGTILVVPHFGTPKSRAFEEVFDRILVGLSKSCSTKVGWSCGCPAD